MMQIEYFIRFKKSFRNQPLFDSYYGNLKLLNTKNPSWITFNRMQTTFHCQYGWSSLITRVVYVNHEIKKFQIELCYFALVNISA